MSRIDRPLTLLLKEARAFLSIDDYPVEHPRQELGVLVLNVLREETVAPIFKYSNIRGRVSSPECPDLVGKADPLYTLTCPRLTVLCKVEPLSAYSMVL